MRVSLVVPFPPGRKLGEEVLLIPDDQELGNGEWSRDAVPQGAIRLTITTPEAFGRFREGEVFEVDLRELAGDVDHAAR